MGDLYQSGWSDVKGAQTLVYLTIPDDTPDARWFSSRYTVLDPGWSCYRKTPSGVAGDGTCSFARRSIYSRNTRIPGIWGSGLFLSLFHEFHQSNHWDISVYTPLDCHPLELSQDWRVTVIQAGWSLRIYIIHTPSSWVYHEPYLKCFFFILKSILLVSHSLQSSITPLSFIWNQESQSPSNLQL